VRGIILTNARYIFSTTNHFQCHKRNSFDSTRSLYQLGPDSFFCSLPRPPLYIGSRASCTHSYYGSCDQLDQTPDKLWAGFSNVSTHNEKDPRLVEPLTSPPEFHLKSCWRSTTPPPMFRITANDPPFSSYSLSLMIQLMRRYGIRGMSFRT
jgi:hypothetical protein